jgi:pyruvate/2-oxoglutarate dehydrogenase complex dihydrolipoamide acyltransferase (E2) component
MHGIPMPQIAIGDDEVTVLAWHKHPGDHVERGEALLEIETEKATMDVESPVEGTLTAQLCQPGDVVTVGQLIATVADSVVLAEAVPPAVEAATPAPAPLVTREERSSVEHGELRGLVRPVSAAATVAGARPEPLSRRRRATARRLTEAAAIPQFSVSRAVELGPAGVAVEGVRADGVRATITDALICAVARTAIAQPRANAWLLDGTLHVFEHAAVAVAVDTPDGVLAPVIQNADQLDLADVARARTDLVERTRSGRVAQHQLEGGTITLSNVGGLGADTLVPLVTPPQVAVIGVGRARDGGGANVATFTFVGDHRALDGADGARFLATLEETLQRLDT